MPGAKRKCKHAQWLLLHVGMRKSPWALLSWGQYPVISVGLPRPEGEEVNPRARGIAGSHLLARCSPNDYMRTLKPSFLMGLVALGALVAAVYWPVRAFDFVQWDDDNNILQNPILTEPWSLPLLKKIFSAEHALRFEPVHWLCCRVIYAVAQYDPSVWHGLGLFWHVAGAILFAQVLRLLLFRLDPQASGRAELLALLGAAVWALHPLRAETVAWVTAATYPLTGTCLLASFFCYLKASEFGGLRLMWLCAAWAFAMLGYGSYPVGITYGLWLVVFDLWMLRRLSSREGPHDPRWWRKHSMFLIPAGIAVLITVWARYSSPGIFTVAPDLTTVGLSTRLIMGLANLSALAWGLVWPVELTPNRIPINLASIGLLSLVLTAAMVALGVCWAAWAARNSRPDFTAVVAGFAVLAIPCLGLTELPTWPVDRYSYLVHLILIGGLTGWIFQVKRLRLWPMVGVVVLLLGLEAKIAREQILHWRDSESLFTQMVRDSRFADSPRQQGHVYVLWGRHLAARQSAERAAEMFNRAQQIYLEAITVAVGRQDYREAFSLSTHIEHHFGLTPVMHRERGVWLFRLGRRAEALRELQLARVTMPDDARVNFYIQEARKHDGTN